MNGRAVHSSANRARALHSFRIGRIAGIDIRIHFTFFLLVVLFAVAGTQPGGPGAPGAVLWLAVIFSCVVVHELAHCVVGRPRGAVVHEIELLPIGGVSKLEKLPEGPADEFAMAIAGPAADADTIERGDASNTVAELAERGAPVVAATDGLEACLALVVSVPARALAVIDEDRLVGLLRGEDVEHIVRRVVAARTTTNGGPRP